MIKAVLFDVDGVLIDTRKSHAMFYQRVLEKAGYKKPTLTEADKCFGLTMRDGITRLTKSSSEEEITRVWNLANANPQLYPSELVKTPKYVRQVLEALSKQYRLGIVTSRHKTSLPGVFKAVAPRGHFDVVVSVEDYSKPKPDPEPLLVAIDRLGVRATETVYVGDHDIDVRAAKAANMKIIAYPRPLKGADAVARRFSTIPSLIGKLE